MNIYILALKISYIGFIVFGILSFMHIFKLGLYALKMEKHELLSKKRWMEKRKKFLAFYFAFVFFIILYKILKSFS